MLYQLTSSFSFSFDSILKPFPSPNPKCVSSPILDPHNQGPSISVLVQIFRVLQNPK
jgi:hypothetical protein